MASGDGLIVRVRPPLGRLSRRQALRLARIAASHGAGVIELSNRANVQLRGIKTERHPAVLRALAGCGLLDADARQEQLRNLVLDPLWTAGDGTQAMATALQQMLATTSSLDALPGKFGWAISGTSCGAQRLAQVPADIRIYKDDSASGFWKIQPDGFAQTLCASTPAQAIAAAQALALWCAAQASQRRQQGKPPGRMAVWLAAGQAAGQERPALPLPEGVSWSTVAPTTDASDPLPGWQANAGLLLAAPLGRLPAAAFAQLAKALNPVAQLRITPWRMLLIEAAEPPDLHWCEIAGLHVSEHWILHGDDARIRISACVGTPGCEQAQGPTQDLALQLAPFVPPGSHLHVSGCAKGCARQQAATLTLRAQQDTTPGTATATTFYAVVRHGKADAAASQLLTASAIHDNPRLLFEEI